MRLLGLAMIKTSFLIFSFVCFYCASFAQANGSFNYGVILTKIASKDTGINTSRTPSVTLTWHDLGMLRKLEPSNAEVLKMLKSTIIHNYTKKHID